MPAARLTWLSLSRGHWMHDQKKGSQGSVAIGTKAREDRKLGEWRNPKWALETEPKRKEGVDQLAKKRLSPV